MFVVVHLVVKGLAAKLACQAPGCLAAYWHKLPLELIQRYVQLLGQMRHDGLVPSAVMDAQ